MPPPLHTLLSAAVAAVGGSPREGQQQMAAAVEHALASGEHLAVQAGTGTGKSLAYLVPSIAHAMGHDSTVVVATATIALQRQLVDRDLPRLADALEPVLERRPSFAILKGRRNYLCLHKLRGDLPEEPDDGALFDPFAASALSRAMTRLHEWADTTTAGDRDELVPGVTEQAWRQVSVTARECLGPQRCPAAKECFAERARATAAKADVVVTNHALLAIDALEGVPVLPEHELVVIDEAHELVDRVTSAATAELTAASVAAAARRCGRVVDQDLADALAEAGDGLAVQLGDAPVGRWDVLPGGRDGGPAAMLAAVRDACAGCRAAMGGERREEPDVAIARRLAVAALEEVHGMAERVLRAYAEADPARRPDVIWLADEERRGRVLRAAPLSVAGLLRDRLFGRSTVVLTSATLALGGSFDALARQWGLPPAKAATPVEGMASAKEPAPDAPRWTGTDVGSPFEHGRSAILYVAKHLPVPGRDGLPESYLDEIEQLITAAGGRALGLFSSMRAAKRATEVLRDRLDVPVLCQGDDSTALLVRRFAEDEATCLFGTLSLWQGVDVPGPALQLVIVDRIPFPRPDDPLMAARQRAVDSRGGNGFLTVAATHAALLLAQGTGRLLRSTTDRGVIAVLDPRLATARYGGFLRASLPPYWQTTDPEVVRAALRRLASGRATAPAPTGVPSAAGG